MTDYMNNTFKFISVISDDAKLKEKQQKQWLKEKEAAEKLRMATIVAARQIFANASKKTKNEQRTKKIKGHRYELKRFRKSAVILSLVPAILSTIHKLQNLSTHPDPLFAATTRARE